MPYPVHDGLDVVNILHDPHQGLWLHQVERDSTGDVLSLGDDSFCDVPDDRGLRQAGFAWISWVSVFAFASMTDAFLMECSLYENIGGVSQ